MHLARSGVRPEQLIGILNSHRLQLKPASAIVWLVQRQYSCAFGRNGGFVGACAQQMAILLQPAAWRSPEFSPRATNL